MATIRADITLNYNTLTSDAYDLPHLMVTGSSRCFQ